MSTVFMYVSTAIGYPGDRCERTEVIFRRTCVAAVDAVGAAVLLTTTVGFTGISRHGSGQVTTAWPYEGNV